MIWISISLKHTFVFMTGVDQFPENKLLQNNDFKLQDVLQVSKVERYHSKVILNLLKFVWFVQNEHFLAVWIWLIIFYTSTG